jgi:hypothetical protein
MKGCPCATPRLGCRIAIILTYDCVLMDSLLNWGAIVLTTLGGALLLRTTTHSERLVARLPNTGVVHFACATAFYWAFQLGLCLSLNDEARCSGVSIVWSAQV